MMSCLCVAVIAGCPADEPCEDLAAPEPQPVELKLTNRRTEPIFVGGGCGTALLLERVGTQTLFSADTCEAPTCESMLDGDCSRACAACVLGVYRVEPGESYTRRWDGTVFSRTDVSSECGQGCTDSCWQETTAAQGEYRLTSTVFFECPETVDDCSCPPGSTDPCFIEAYDGVVNGQRREVDFSMPAGGVVELFID